MHQYMAAATMKPACGGRTPTPSEAADVALAQPDGAPQAVKLPLDAADRRRHGPQPPQDSCAPSAGAAAPGASGPWGGLPMRAPGFRPPEPSGRVCRGHKCRAGVVGPHETVQSGIESLVGCLAASQKHALGSRHAQLPQCAVARCLVQKRAACEHRMLSRAAEGREELEWICSEPAVNVCFI